MIDPSGHDWIKGLRERINKALNPVESYIAQNEMQKGLEALEARKPKNVNSAAEAAAAMEYYKSIENSKSAGKEIVSYIAQHEERKAIEANRSNRDNCDSNDLNKIGIYLNQIEFNTNSKVKEIGPVKAQAYTVVPNNSNNAGKSGYFTEYQYNLLIAQVAHEAGGVSITNCYGVASAILNLSESQYKGNIIECINNSCVKFESPADSIYTNYISKVDGTLYTNKRGNELANAKIAVDAAISGTRAFSSEVKFWVGNGRYNRFSTTYKESSNF